MIALTENAINAVSRFLGSSETAALGLRVAVSGGGCSGMQYGLKLESEPAAEDQVLEFGGLKVFVDPASAPLLEGVTMDFVENMTESGFKFTNPNAKASCSCGKSFSC